MIDILANKIVVHIYVLRRNKPHEVKVCFMPTHCALCRHMAVHMVPCVDTFYLFHRHMLIQLCRQICRLP
jgi:hypothetical protein